MTKLFSLRIWMPVLYFVGSILLLLGIWTLIAWCNRNPEATDLVERYPLPTPLMTLDVLSEIFANPFQNDPDVKGIGTKLIGSLMRVGIGFGLGSLIAIPLGLLLGSSKFMMSLINPIVQILRPVSPLAWYPLGLAVFSAAGGGDGLMNPSSKAAIFMIFICSLWPTLINTAFGVASIPQDHKNVGKAFGFSVWKYITRILLPYSLPHIVTGLKLSIGVAWMVIVAGEMLSGGDGLGFFVWEEGFNAGKTTHIIVAILIIGIVGFILDKFFSSLQKAFSYDAK
ncbi:ABC transporter permease [Xanthocytophaga agilis]|uniref:ABC transporter permease subunit n=1 Tax=Xanthocytophaga agilis TaxID=3048010 RepID=A0AAE3R090_9BACT|nr:ABC transporter permease subunit [Xanthocytophaga agilis]MDJ1500750.1 ABC transporter permease subunit [Xanthocytophaga agilis]